MIPRYGWDRRRQLSLQNAFNSKLGWDAGRFPYEPETLAYFALPGATGDIRALDLIIKALKAGGTLTLSGWTGKLSTVNGTAFATQCSVDMRQYLGFKATWLENGHSASAWLRDAGVVETYGGELITSFPISTLNTLTVAAPNITQGVNSSGAERYAYSNNVTTGNDSLLKFITTVTKASGSYPSVFFNFAATSPSIVTNGTPQTVYVAQTTQQRMVLFDCFANVDFSAVNTLKQVLTPSATGATLVSAKGGSVYNMETMDVGGTFNKNATSWTVYITAQ